MPDFGDDFGDSLKRFSSMFLRELFHQWLRDSQKNGYYHETIGGEDFDVKLFDDDTQREIFEQKLREAGIEFTEKSVPAVRFNTKDRKAIEKIYQEVIKDIDTGTYTPNKKEAEFVASQPADAQTQYDLSRLADNGLIPKEELAALGRNYTMGDAMKMLDGHKEAKEQFLTERKYRDLHKEATQEVNDLVKNDPKSLDKPATRSQMKTLESAKEQGVLSDAELKLMGKDGLTVKEASFILDQHPEIAGKLNLSKGLDLDPATSGDDASNQGQAGTQDSNQQATDAAAGANTEDDGNAASASQSQGVSGGSGWNASQSQGHQHNWVAQTKTVHHDAVYRTVNHPAKKERRTICNTCHQDVTNCFAAHRSASGHTSTHYEYKVTQDAYTERVLISAAYDETVTTGYRCSVCGATK